MAATLINAPQDRAGGRPAGDDGPGFTPEPDLREETSSCAPAGDHDHARDVVLMTAIQAGDEAALEDLRQRHWPLIRFVVAKTLPCAADVEETVQDIFLEIWRCATNYDPALGKPLGWMVRVARRRAIDRHRKNAVRLRLRQQLEAEALADDWTQGNGGRPGADHSPAGLSDLRRFLERQLEALPSGQREALHLNFFGQLSHREIARRTGIPLGTIRTRLLLALKRLAGLTEDYREQLR